MKNYIQRYLHDWLAFNRIYEQLATRNDLSFAVYWRLKIIIIALLTGSWSKILVYRSKQLARLFKKWYEMT